MQEQMNELVLEMARILDGRKAEDIVMIDIREQTIIADYFIVCSGRSSTHIKTLADELSQEMAQRGMPRHRIEGYQAGRWIVLDFGEVLVHIFHQEEREFYDVERLWISGDNSKRYGE